MIVNGQPLSTLDLPTLDADVADFMAQFYADPLGHVLASYPWGEGMLRGREGPLAWQGEYLIEVGQQVRERGFNGFDPVEPIQFSTVSGHGIGKSAMSAWLNRWIMDTRPWCKGTVTANTAQQLRTKTWAEMAKWHSMALTQHLYTLNAGSGSMNYYRNEAGSEGTFWRVDAHTCDERNSEAFAGQHAVNSTSWYLFDEASAVPEKIYEVREGGLTDGEPMTFDFGNGTRNTGRFYEQHEGRFRHGIIRRHIDSRDVEITNKRLLQRWIDTYGIDSDFVKVRVLGQFPSMGETQFIPMDVINRCIDLEVMIQPFDPLVMGVDVGRFGGDRSVIRLRHGRDAESPGVWKYRDRDTMFIAGEVARIAKETRPDAIFIDGGGVGGGVIDRCRQLGLEVIEINFGGKATQPEYANLRAQMYGNLRDAMEDGIRIADDEDLIVDLRNIEYGYNIRNQIQLERKEDMKERTGLDSPDDGDALALTYVLPVYPSRLGYGGSDTATASEYDPYN